MVWLGASIARSAPLASYRLVEQERDLDDMGATRSLLEELRLEQVRERKRLAAPPDSRDDLRTAVPAVLPEAIEVHAAIDDAHETLH